MFYSVKGEGLYTGVPMLFVRFMDCNRVCKFCDTPRSEAMVMTLTADAILAALKAMDPVCSRVVLTGGEPLIQPFLEELVTALAQKGYYIHFETNGDCLEGEVENLIADYAGRIWTAMSPKVYPGRIPHWINEIKWLVGDGTELWQEAIRRHCTHPVQYLQPVSDPNPDIWSRNVRTCLQIAKEYPRQFRYSIQLHKAIGVR